MAAVLTVCAAKASTQVVSQLMEECTIDDPEWYLNVFTLVPTPDEELLDEYCQPPTEDFATAFEGWSDSQLRQWFHQRMSRLRGITVERGFLAVLDDKSAAQSTVVIHFRFAKETLDQYPHLMDARGDLDEHGHYWWKWRVRFRSAYKAFNELKSCEPETVDRFMHPGLIDPEGILDVDRVCDGQYDSRRR
ncbi:hypothetical protein BDW62DRAFT_191306 [Aspergillus aurantiobrunneus]